MKKIGTAMLLTGMLIAGSIPAASAQSVTDVIEELTLDYQKLANMKSTLKQMYSGYAMLTKGYNAVRGVSMDNFNLHKTFLEAQLLVSPGVRAYPRSAAILQNQQALLREYHDASQRFSSNAELTGSEKQFLGEVYQRLTQAAADNLDELNRVTTDSQLRMTDAERLGAIDRLYQQSQDQLEFLRKFNDQVAEIIRQRQAARDSRRQILTLYR